MKKYLWFSLLLPLLFSLPAETAFAAIAKQKTETVSRSEHSGVSSKTIKKEKKGHGWWAKKKVGWKAAFEKLKQKFDLGIQSKFLKICLVLVLASILFFVLGSFIVLDVLFFTLGSVAVIGAMVFLVLWLLEKTKKK